jgi:hypothetical protein
MPGTPPGPNGIPGGAIRPPGGVGTCGGQPPGGQNCACISPDPAPGIAIAFACCTMLSGTLWAIIPWAIQVVGGVAEYGAAMAIRSPSGPWNPGTDGGPLYAPIEKPGIVSRDPKPPYPAAGGPDAEDMQPPRAASSTIVHAVRFIKGPPPAEKARDWISWTTGEKAERLPPVPKASALRQIPFAAFRLYPEVA